MMLNPQPPTPLTPWPTSPQTGKATAPWTWTVTVLLDTSLPEARQCVSPSMGLLEETPEGVLLRSGVDDLNWMARYLVWLGFPFVVQEPPELVTALRDLAAEVARTAEGGGRRCETR